MYEPRSEAGRILRPSRGLILEITLVLLAAIAIGRFVHAHGGQVFGTDSLMYLDTGLRGHENPFILNRYTHVYLFRTFAALASTTLEGLRLYSGVVAGLSILLIYFSARALSRKSSPINGILAVGLFLGLPMILERLLAPTVDTSVMLLMLGLLAVYLGSGRNHHQGVWPIFLFGLIFFLALRTKETAVIAGVLLVGFGFESDHSFSGKKWARSMGYVLAGMLSAALLTILANTLVLGTPLFGFRLIDLLEYRQRWSETLRTAEGSGVSFQSLVLAVATGVPFLLYVAAGVLAKDRLPVSIRMIWALPLALVGMLILFSTRGQWGIVPRGFLPGFAILCALGSQLPVLGSFRETPRKELLIATLGSLLVIAVLGGIGLLARGEQPYEVYFLAAFAPIALCSILAVLFLARDSTAANLAIVVLLLPLILYPIRLALGQVATKPTALTENARFQILLTYRERIQETDLLKLYLTTDALPLLAIDANPDELASLVNVALDLKTTREQYTIGTPDTALVRAMIEGEYSHLLITNSEWEWLRTEPQDRPEWRQRYEAFLETGERFVLLRLVDRAQRN